MHRLEARLARLPPDVLAHFAARACRTSNETLADELLALHDPLPTWAVAGVLSATDLLQELLSPLAEQDVFASQWRSEWTIPAVCSAWRRAWSILVRRVLRPAPPLPRDGFRFDNGCSGGVVMCGLPDGERLCMVGGERPFSVVLVDRQMNEVQRIEGYPHGVQGVAATPLGLYLTVEHGDRPCVARLHINTFDELARYTHNERDSDLVFPTPAPGVLFVIENSCILALDALTLELRFRFGRDDDRYSGMTVIGDELYIGDHYEKCICVYSFTGEHLRNILVPSGVKYGVRDMWAVEDRLYLSDMDMNYDGDDEAGCERRIFVLTPAGQTLRICRVSPHLKDIVMSTCYFDGKVFASILDLSMRDGGGDRIRLRAFHGL